MADRHHVVEYLRDKILKLDPKIVIKDFSWKKISSKQN